MTRAAFRTPNLAFANAIVRGQIAAATRLLASVRTNSSRSATQSASRKATPRSRETADIFPLQIRVTATRSPLSLGLR